MITDDDTCDQNMLKSATVHLNSNSADFNSEVVAYMYIHACDCHPVMTILSQLDLVGDIDMIESCSAVIP